MADNDNPLVDDGGSGGGTSDAGTSDAGTSDAGTSDAGTSDAGTSDAGTSDAGTSDAGTSDAGTSDAGTSDAGTSDAGTSDAGTSDAGSTPNILTNDQAQALINAANITVQSSGNCSDRNNSSCTSLDGVRKSTIDGIIAFQQESGVDLIITGGTEVGHTQGTFSHGNGYKLDISRTDEVTNYIHNNFTFTGKRSDGADLYEDGNGNVYADEKSKHHWDITFK